MDANCLKRGKYKLKFKIITEEATEVLLNMISSNWEIYFSL